MDITTMARTIDTIVERETGDNRFNIDAILYGCDNDGAYLIESGHDDPYDVIAVADRPSDLIGAALVVCGWASPYSQDDRDNPVRPSEHPSRIRVRVVVCITDQGFSTMIRRADCDQQADQTVILSEQPQGALAQVLSDWWNGTS